MESAESFKLAGNDHYKNKQYQQAVDSYTRAIGLDSENAPLYTNRAAAYLMMLMYRDAMTDCDKAISLDPSNSRAYFRKCTALRGLGRLDDAIACLTRGIEIDGTAVAAVKEKNDLLGARKALSSMHTMVHEEKKYRAALQQLEPIIREIGNFRDFNILKVICLVKLGRLEDAYNLSNLMMRTAANGDVELLHVRADCLYAMGDLENALKHLQQAMRSDPDNTNLRTFYRKVRDIEEKKHEGADAFKRGAYQEAIDQWGAAIDLVQDSKIVKAKLHYNRGTALSKIKRHEDAVADCGKAIALDPEYIKAYLKRAECNFSLGGADRLKEAISDYEKVESLQGDSEDAKIDCKSKIKQAKVALKRAGRKDFYAILGVAQDADEDDIRKAYKKMALKWHPDRHSSKSDEEKAEAEKQFKQVGEAYECLIDPEKKSRYDQGVDPEDLDNPHAGHGGCGGGHGGMGGIDPNILFQMFMQQNMGGGGRGRSHFG